MTTDAGTPPNGATARTVAASGGTTTYREAVRESIRQAMLLDERVFLMGEDIGAYGGGHGVSQGLLEQFGPERIRDTPLSENGFVGTAVGAAPAVVVDEGWRTGSLAAEVATRIHEDAFYDLDAPVQRVCSQEVPLPYARHLEQAALPSTEKVVAACLSVTARA